MLLGNEEGPRLFNLLARLVCEADQIVILGDSPTDATENICRSFGKVKYKDTGYGKSIFKQNMSRLYVDLWEHTRDFSRHDDWILNLDADQDLNPAFYRRLPDLLSLHYHWIGCRLYDLWVPGYYRVDGYWSPLVSRLYRFRDLPWGRKMTRHASNLPSYLDADVKGVTYDDIGILHYGWILPEEKRLEKQKFYMSLDMPGSVNYAHALSITNPPVLKPVP